MSEISLKSRVGDVVEFEDEGTMQSGEVVALQKGSWWSLFTVIADLPVGDGEKSTVTVFLPKPRCGGGFEEQERGTGVWYVGCYCGERFRAAVLSDLADARRRYKAHLG